MDDDESSVSLRCSTTGPPPLPLLLLLEVLRLLMLLMGCRNGVEVKKGLRFSTLLGLENDKNDKTVLHPGLPWISGEL